MNSRTLNPCQDSQDRIYIIQEGICEPVTVVSNIVSGVSKPLYDFDNPPPTTFSIPHLWLKTLILGGGSKRNPLKAKKIMSLLKNIQKLW